VVAHADDAFEERAMIRYGCTLSSEEFSPDRLVALARQAEQAGFDFVAISDHYHPWTSRQGESPFVWAEDEASARRTVLEYWPNAGVPGRLARELPLPSHFEEAAKPVDEETAAQGVATGPDPSGTSRPSIASSRPARRLTGAESPPASGRRRAPP
jgi:Luciferase-like monooxygenase